MNTVKFIKAEYVIHFKSYCLFIVSLLQISTEATVFKLHNDEIYSMWLVPHVLIIV